MEEDGFMIRMEKEGKELEERLEERLEKLTSFLNSIYSMSPEDKEEFFKKNDMDDGDVDLLQAQVTTMATYANILRIRYNIARLKRQLPTIAQF